MRSRILVSVVIPLIVLSALLGLRLTTFHHLPPLSLSWWVWVLSLIVAAVGFGSGLQSVWHGRHCPPR